MYAEEGPRHFPSSVLHRSVLQQLKKCSFNCLHMSRRKQVFRIFKKFDFLFAKIEIIIHDNQTVEICIDYGVTILQYFKLLVKIQVATNECLSLSRILQ